MLCVQTCSAKSPQGNKRLKEIDRKECECFCVDILFEKDFREIPQRDKGIDKYNGDKDIDHE